MKEHDIVRLVSAVHDKRRVFAAGTTGTIVSVYDGGKAFAVELRTPRRKLVILTVPAEFLAVVLHSQPPAPRIQLERLQKAIADLDTQIHDLMERRVKLTDQQEALSGSPPKPTPVLGPATHLVRVTRVVEQTSYVWWPANTPTEALEFAKESRACLYSKVLRTATSLASLKQANEHRDLEAPTE